MFKILPFLLFFSCTIIANAQEFGGFRPSKLWYQVETENYRIIFGKDAKEEAQQVANTFTQMNGISPNIGDKRRKIDLVLQDRPTRANGYVGAAPFRSEYFLNPPSDNYSLGSTNWAQLLAIHENQHVLQYSNSMYGLTKLALLIAGDNFFGVFQRLSVPNWFMEGDAVRAETEYGLQGRGRIPSFMNDFRQYSLEGNLPKYSVIRNGSINKYYPNHYPLGYLMAKYGKDTYGDEFWTKVLRDATAYKGLFYPFSKALKRHSGLKVKEFYHASFDYFKDSSTVQVEEKTYKTVENYYFPKYLEDGSLIYYKDSYDQIGAFYKKGDKEELLHRPGIRISNYFDANDSLIVYAKSNFHPRWFWDDYSNLSLINYKQGKEIQLTEKARYFSPAISQNGKSIAAVFSSTKQKYAIHILSIENPKEIDSIPNPENYYHNNPQWLNDSFLICTSRSWEGKMALTKVNIQTGETEALTPWTIYLLGVPEIKNKNIYFSANFDGLDHIYQYSLADSKVYKLTDKPNGQYQVSINSKENSLITSNFGLWGNRLEKLAISKKEAFQIPKEYVKPLTAFEQIDTKSTIKLDSSSNFQIERYRKVKHLINVYSWSTTFNDPNYSLQINSENILNNLRANMGVNYNTNENGAAVYGNVIYAGFFPVLNMSISRLQRSNTFRGREFRWLESYLSTGAIIPLDLSSNLYIRGLSFGTSYNFNEIDSDNDFVGNIRVHSASALMTYRQQRIKAKKNIFTHLGIYSNLDFTKGIEPNEVGQLLFQNSISSRGLFKNHNLMLDFDAQLLKGKESYTFQDNYFYSRGFDPAFYDDIYKVSLNYHLPLIYPNAGFGGIIFFQRIRANAYFDYSQTFGNFIGFSLEQNYTSCGLEIIFDTKMFNSFSSTFGIRYGRILEGEFLSSNGREDFIEVFIPIRRF